MHCSTRIFDFQTEFFGYVRMYPPMFDYLLSLVCPALEKHCHRRAVLVYKWFPFSYLGHGSTLDALHIQFKWCYETIRTTIHRTTAAIFDILSPTYMPTPSKDDDISHLTGAEATAQGWAQYDNGKQQLKDYLWANKI